VLSSSEERPRVLVVDDEKFIRDILADFLGMEGYLVRTAEDGTAAVAELERARYDLVISDLKMPKMGGIELLEHTLKQKPSVLTVIMTGFGTVETAIDAMKRGAYDYVLKPFKVDEVIHVVQRGLEKQRLEADNIRMKEALALYKVSEAIQSSLSVDQVVQTLVDTARQELEADSVRLWLEDGEGGFVSREGESTAATGTPSLAALQKHFTLSESLFEHGKNGAPFFEQLPEGEGLGSILGVALRSGTRLFGFLVVYTHDPRKRLEEGQRKLLSIVASRAAAAIDNTRLYLDLRASFQQTIQGLAKAIDRMDRYTSGHSDRVATYAMMLGRRLHLPPDVIEIVRQSALMHDIGKIGCVLNLNKPGKLTQDEYEVFKKHPGYGRDILEPIKFLHPLIPGVHLHHERWDGRGYPLGLKGEHIPLIARIISVADTYDAMTSDRAYRKALPHEVAVTEVERCAGGQFDPDMARDFATAIEDYRTEEQDSGRKVPE
jgi:response regulator RpfG family c-di-GMP phosphodiesterase